MNPLCYVIDIGTNSARLMLCAGDHFHRKCVYKTHITIRLKECPGHFLTEAAIGRTVCALLQFQSRMRREFPNLPVLCFATSAVRDAENRDRLLTRAKEQTGLLIDVLNGEQEALCGFLGATDGHGGVIDVGGGSTEIVFGSHDKISYQQSFDIGAVRCKALLGADASALKKAQAWASDLFTALPDAHAQETFYAVGGTATTLAAIHHQLQAYDPQIIQGTVLSLSEISETLAMLSRRSLAQRRQTPGLEPDRADIILYGIVILIEAMKALRIAKVMVSDSDNLEGYLSLRIRERAF